MFRRFVAMLVVSSFLAVGCAPEGPAGEERATSTARAEDGASGGAAARGEGLVDALGCRDCHEDPSGATGALGGRKGSLARPAGPNLTPDGETGLGEWSDDAIVRAIRDGVDNEGEALCASMPRFSALSDDDGAAVVAYLRSLTPERSSIEGSCPADRGARPHVRSM